MWIVITLVAAMIQIARTSEQHRLRSVLGVAEAGYVRFAYAFPVAAVLLTLWTIGPGELPVTGSRFWLSVLGGGVSQILATMSLLHSFRLRDFAVGTIYAKTEVLFVAAASTLVLGEPIAPIGWVGALICALGVAYLASPGSGLSVLARGLEPAAWFGMLAGLGFGLAAVGIRSASASLDGAVVDRAALTLTAMLGLQTMIQGVALARSSTASLRNVARAWRQAIGVAALSLAGSAAWAIAVTLENAAKVRTLGQVEILLAFVIGVVVHGERHGVDDYAAGLVAAGGITLLVLA